MVVVVGTYLGASKDIPFTKPYELKAVFTNANNIKPKSPVRIAGVEVGKVSKIERRGEDSTDAVVTMKIQKRGLPIHKDATLKIRPRIFLEGNFFVDLKPGTPDQPSVDSGDTIPMNQTSAPVQIDQVLSSLQKDTRLSLKQLLVGYGEAIDGKPTKAEDKDQAAISKGETAAKSLNDAIDYGKDAFRQTALVNEALLGVEIHDLSKLIRGQQKVFAALDQNEAALQDLITNFNLTTAAFADESGNLSADDRDPAGPPAHGGHDVQRPERRLPAHPRLREGNPAGRARHPGHDRGGLPLDRPDPGSRVA